MLKIEYLWIVVQNKLFNRLFQSGYFPPCWSQSIIVPLHEKGDINCTDNYRCISLLYVFGKMYVSSINRQVTFYANVYENVLKHCGSCLCMARILGAQSVFFYFSTII